MEHDDRLIFFGLLIFTALILLPVFFVGAQDEAPAAGLTPNTALALTAVREAGLQAYRRDDTAAIDAVISFRAANIYRTDYVSALMRATNNAPVRLDAPRPWITQLRTSTARPPLWPRQLRWQGRNDEHWRQTWHHARDVRRGDIEHSCSMTPHDWGSEHDSVRFRRLNPTAIELDCGQTCSLNRDGSQRYTRDGMPRCNHFFHIPRYGARFDEG